MRLRVREVMSSDVITISSSTPLKEAAVTMTDRGVSGLPVVDEGHLVGIITESDFVARLAGEGDGLMAMLFGRRPEEISGTVADVMSNELRTIGPDESVTAAARKMSELRVKRLPVVDGSGALVGIVSRVDLMAVFARPDHQIASDILSDGVTRLLGAHPGSVNVEVRDGVVSLDGRVDTVTEKRMLEEFARRVAGVVAVNSSLAVTYDETRLPPT